MIKKKNYNSEVNIPVDGITLKGDLFVPEKAKALIVFSHGTGSNRLSSRNRQVANYLHELNFATLLFDQLTEEENRSLDIRFNKKLMTSRLTNATNWIENHPKVNGLPIGLFGASTGAACALHASIQLPNVFAVVSRGGRPDLVMDVLPWVITSTLLIVGSLDTEVLKLNRKAKKVLQCEKKLRIINGASHLFEENKKIEKVALLAADWFKNQIPSMKTA